MTTTRADIEQALAAGPTDGPWRHNKDNEQIGDVSLLDGYMSIVSAQAVINEPWQQRDINAAYIAAVNPAAIRQLFAEEDARHDAEKKALEDELVRVGGALTALVDRDFTTFDGKVIGMSPSFTKDEISAARAALSPTTTKD